MTTTQFTHFTSNGGHSAKSPGASSGGYKEHEQTRLMNKAFIKAMKARGVEVTDTTSDAKNRSAVLIEQVAKANRCNGGNKQLDLSWHLNDGGGTGTEVLVYDNSCSLAAKISATIAKALDVRDRGIKTRPDLYFLRCTKHTALIVEVCFIDSDSDMKKLEAKRQLVAEAVADLLVGKPSTSTKPSTQQSTASTSSAALDTNSLVDYLKATGRPSSFAARAELAVEYGILKNTIDYSGSFAQNCALLAALKGAAK